MIIKAEPIPADVTWVRLREADEAECLADGVTGADAVRQSANGSLESYMITADDEPVAFWGYSMTSLVGGNASAWLLTLPAVESCRFRLARSSRRVIDYLLKRAQGIVVETHLDHAEAVKWLLWLGFDAWGMPKANGLQLMIKRRA